MKKGYCIRWWVGGRRGKKWYDGENVMYFLYTRGAHSYVYKGNSYKNYFLYTFQVTVQKSIFVSSTLHKEYKNKNVCETHADDR